MVNFKKLKEKGEEKMQAPFDSKEHYTGQAIRERLVELDFKEEFIEKILKEYSVKKIEEKLDLLMERRNIQSPAGWLSAALKNDYQDPEQERYDEEPVDQESQTIRMDSRFHGNLNSQIPSPLEGDKKILSSEEARRRFHLLRHKLKAMN
ncbi:MAG: hypothetical protein FP833_04440 [Atribacteria sp.]|nr:hypothetical protein [Candidatus Atribacteria bacterium]